jgi:hypothetical protein
VLEPDGTPSQFFAPPFGLWLAPCQRILTPLNWLLVAIAKRKAARAAAHMQSLAWPDALDSSTIERQPWNFSRIPLIHPEALAFAREEERFEVRQRDLFCTFGSPCDVLRTMNVLNLCYFSREQLLRGVAAAWADLATGGIWIVGRTIIETGENHATIFHKEAAGFQPLERLGNGSEIEDLVVGYSNERADPTGAGEARKAR